MKALRHESDRSAPAGSRKKTKKGEFGRKTSARTIGPASKEGGFCVSVGQLNGEARTLPTDSLVCSRVKTAL